jgi:hypothetical protein
MRLQVASTVVLLLSVFWFLLRSIHWPLVGDATLMHYVVFLIDHGRVPYREIGDMNFPGAYLPDWVIIRTFGGDALAWRIYDLFLLLLGGVSLYVITRPASWFAGVWAATLFALIHGRDGLYQVGQRDLAVAILSTLGVAILFQGVRSKPICASFIFGLSLGTAFLIKPTASIFILLAAPLLRHFYKTGVRAWQSMLAIVGGWVLPICLAVGWLARYGALQAFLRTESTLARYHAALGCRSIGYLLQHSFSPVLPVAILWLLLRLLSKSGLSSTDLKDDWNVFENQTLLLGVALGLAVYIVQGKGYPYHRYSLLAFLLAIMARDFDAMLRRKEVLRWIGATVFVATSIFVGCSSALALGRYEWQTNEFQRTLEIDLIGIETQLGESTLSGKVQCLDSISGCVATLYDMKLVQSSSLIYDEYLFHPAGTPAVDDTRASFWRAIQAAPPLVFVVTDPLFPDGPNHYEKLTLWPDFTLWLNKNYALKIEHPSMKPIRQGGPAFTPAGYRIYVQRQKLNRSRP